MTFKEYKVSTKTNWIGSQTFEVHELEYEVGKPPKLINDVKLFSGSITECESFLNLLKQDDISR